MFLGCLSSRLPPAGMGTSLLRGGDQIARLLAAVPAPLQRQRLRRGALLEPAGSAPGAHQPDPPVLACENVLTGSRPVLEVDFKIKARS